MTDHIHVCRACGAEREHDNPDCVSADLDDFVCVDCMNDYYDGQKGSLFA